MKRTCLLAATLVLATGCGSGTGSGTGGGTGGSGGGTSGSLNRGTANITQQDQGTSFFRGASASFYPMGLPAEFPDPACTFTTSGTCKIRDCKYDGGTSPRGDAGTQVGAGMMIAQVGAGTAITLTRGSSGSYLGFMSGSSVWWDGGETVTLTASGGDGGAPAFTSTLSAPTFVSVTSPANDGGSLAYSKSAGLTVGWGGGTGENQVILSGGMTTAHFVQAVCAVSASAGTFTIPSAVTQVLPAGAGILYLQNTTRTTTAAGDWSIETSASSVSAARTTNAQ